MCVCAFVLFSGCEAGRFGLSCEQSCDCAGEAQCDPLTGRCLCPPGRTGQRCEKGRRPLEGSTLSPAEMQICRNSENKGTTPSFCKSLPHVHSVVAFSASDCAGDRFGPDCSLQCQCSHRARCDGLNGRCLCPLTWLGPTCSEGEPKLSYPHTHT